MLKRLFLLPELLLFLGIFIWPVYLGNSSMDIHLHDTYYVIGGFAGQLFLLPLHLMLFLSWIMHQLLRRKGLLPPAWRWAQVIITLICLLVFPFSISNEFGAGMPRRYFDYGTFDAFYIYQRISILCIIVLILCQVSFWIAAAILLAKNFRTR